MSDSSLAPSHGPAARSVANRARTHRFPRALGVVIATTALLVQAAFAFPPAPPFTVHGIARDSFGWALESTDQAIVFIKRDDVIIAEAPIDHTTRPGENFRASVPMDTETGDPYREGAQNTGITFTLEVRFPTTILPVVSLSADLTRLGEPSGSVFLDFSVGADADGDRIPDSWEWQQLTESGFRPGQPEWTLDTLGTGDFDADGISDYSEYLAGTFAFLFSDSIEVRLKSFTEDGFAELLAQLVIDKTYRLESSEDHKSWGLTKVRPGSKTAELAKTFTVDTSGDFTLYAPLPDDPARLFYRLVLVR